MGYIHSTGYKIALSRSFEVNDGQPLVFVLLGGKARIVIHSLDECFQTFGNGIRMQQSVLVACETKQCCGTYRTVNLGHDHALRQETAHHSARVFLPIIGQCVYIHWVKKQYIVGFEVLHNIVSQPSMCAVDDHIGTYLPNEVCHIHKRRHGINVVSLFHQRTNEVCGVGYRTRNNHFFSTFPEKAVRLHVFLIAAYGGKLQLFFLAIVCREEEIIRGSLFRFLRCSGENNLPVHVST